MCGKSFSDQGSPTKWRGNKRIDPSRQSQGKPESRSGAMAVTEAAGAAQPRQPEQPEPQQLPQPSRHPGAQPLLFPEEIAAGEEYCNQQLDADSNWIATMGGQQKACVDIIVNKVPRFRDRAQKCWRTISRRILKPVLAERSKHRLTD